MKIKITKDVKDPNADQWGLYFKGGRERAAKSLNTAFRKAVNAGLSERDVYSAAVREMHAQSAFGAADTEGYHRLGCLMRAIFGPDAYC